MSVRQRSCQISPPDVASISRASTSAGRISVFPAASCVGRGCHRGELDRRLRAARERRQGAGGTLRRTGRALGQRHEARIVRERRVKACGDAGGQIDHEALGGGAALRAAVEHRGDRQRSAVQLQTGQDADPAEGRRRRVQGIVGQLADAIEATPADRLDGGGLVDGLLVVGAGGEQHEPGHDKQTTAHAALPQTERRGAVPVAGRPVNATHGKQAASPSPGRPTQAGWPDDPPSAKARAISYRGARG